MCFDIFTLSYSLLVEEIDLGDGNVRQVVSGLAKYCNPEDLTVRDWLALLPSFDIYLPVYVPFWDLDAFISIIGSGSCYLLYEIDKCKLLFDTESSSGANYECETWKTTRCDVCWIGRFLLHCLNAE